MNAAQRLQVCVVGGGLTGLACALAAARAGAQVRVHEARGARPVMPAHVNLSPSLVRDLVSLGLGERLAVEGFPYRRLVVRDIAGRQCFEIPWQPLAGRRHPAAVGIAHGTLARLLEDAAVATGVRMHRGASIAGIEMDGPRARLRMAGGEGLRPHVIVLATGADCLLRDHLFPDAGPVRSWPHRWLHTMVPRPRGLDDMTLTLAPGGGPKLLLVPVDGRLAGLALSCAAASDGQNDARLGEILAWLQRGSDWTRTLATLLPADQPMAARPMRSRLVAGDWHRGNVLLAGDGAHLFAPQFGQSVPQGVEDAIVIGQLVQAAGQVGIDTLGALYTARRRPRTAQVHALVEQAARWDLAPDASTDLMAVGRRLFEAVALPP